jgi:LysM repeat protein
MYRRRAPAARQEGTVLGSGRAQKLRRPTRKRVYRPIRGYKLATPSADPAPAAVVGILALALLVVLFATGTLGRQPTTAVGGDTPIPSPSAPSPSPTPTASPTAPPTPSPTVAPTTRVHVVQRGENLSKIAQQYGVTVAEIVEANDLTNPSQINVGQELIIPASG